jgi:hypothetical protein
VLQHGQAVTQMLQLLLWHSCVDAVQCTLMISCNTHRSMLCRTSSSSTQPEHCCRQS